MTGGTAGVGTATVLRRSGGPGGLLEAAIATGCRNCATRSTTAHHRRALRAHLDALFDVVLANRALIHAPEHRDQKTRTPTHQIPRADSGITGPGRRIRAVHPDSDAACLADIVFTSMRADVVDYLRQHQRMSTKRIREGPHDLADPRRERD